MNLLGEERSLVTVFIHKKGRKKVKKKKQLSCTRCGFSANSFEPANKFYEASKLSPSLLQTGSTWHDDLRGHCRMVPDRSDERETPTVLFIREPDSNILISDQFSSSWEPVPRCEQETDVVTCLKMNSLKRDWTKQNNTLTFTEYSSSEQDENWNNTSCTRILLNCLVKIHNNLQLF